MRIHPVNFLLALMICALLTYGIVSIDANGMKLTTGIGSFVFLSSTLAVAIGLQFKNGRAGVNVSMVALLFFVAALLLNLLFAFIAFSQVTYIVTCGVAFSGYVLLAQSISSAEQ